MSPVLLLPALAARAELPLPRLADGSEAPDHDANGDGVVNIRDWAEDPTVDLTAGDDVADALLDPSDLIWTFSDGIDDDGNGFVDDIAGWDRYFGQGRVNAWRAVEALVAGEIPPEADISTPAWFDLLDPTLTPQVEVSGLARADRDAVAAWVLEAAVGLDPLEAEFSEVASGTAAVDGVLGTWDIASLPLDPEAIVAPYGLDEDQVGREEAVNLHTVTLRLRVTDTQGRAGHARRVVYVQHDPDALPGWPIFLGSSQEASPKLYDLDDDGALDIIQADSAGVLHALRADGTELPGFPVDTAPLEELDPAHPDNHLDNPLISEFSGATGGSIVGTPAVGDLDGDGQAELVLGTARGHLYVFESDGSLRAGFPVQQDPVDFEGLEPAGWPKFTGQWILSSPAVGDIDGDGLYEVVVGTRSGWLFAWDTPAAQGAPADWPMYGHDAQNTRDATTPLPDHGPGAEDVDAEDEGCGCATPGAFLGIWPLGLLLAWRRRRA